MIMFKAVHSKKVIYYKGKISRKLRCLIFFQTVTIYRNFFLCFMFEIYLTKQLFSYFIGKAFKFKNKNTPLNPLSKINVYQLVVHFIMINSHELQLSPI